MLLLCGGLAALAGAAHAQAPAQAERGRTLFVERGCPACHKFDGQGTAVGPDLKNIAALSPRAISIAIRSTRTQYVIAIKLKDGAEFPAMRVSQDDAGMQVYDLSADPPALRKLERAAIETTRDNDSWKHPPAATGMSAEQMADVIAYIRWIALRDKKGVDPEDVQ
jgi:putative heme-binding domain-containing protein